MSVFNVVRPIVKPIVRSIVNPRSLLSYVVSGRVLDLFASFSSGSTTIPDSSPEGNDATLYTGRFATTDGVLDRGIVADCSAAGAGTYYLTGKIRPTATAVARITIDGSTSSTVTGLTADVWQTFQTATSGSITPSSVVVGWDGTTASAGDWSDIRLINAATGAEVAHWQLNESADSDLDGYPALDSSGNGYHGTHTGCAGGTGEATILQTAGMNWNKGGTLPPFYTSDFSAGTDGWSPNGATVTGNIDGIGALDNWLRVTIDSSVSASHHAAISTLTVGQDYDIETQVFIPSSNTIVDGVGIRVGGADVPTITTVAADTVVTVSRTSATADGTFLEIRAADGVVTAFTGNGTDVFYIRNIQISEHFSSILVPESDTTAGEDVLGTAIAEPRVNSSQFNFFGDGEYASVADADSLDVTTQATWELWGDFYGDRGSNESYLSKTDVAVSASRSFQILRVTGDLDSQLRLNIYGTGLNVKQISSITDKVSHIVFVYNIGAVTAYVDGVSVAVSDFLGPAQSSIQVTTTPVGIGARLSSGVVGNLSSRKIARPKIYNVALTADEVLQNYNAQKSAFGL